MAYGLGDYTAIRTENFRTQRSQNEPPRAVQNEPPRAVQNEPPRAAQNDPPRAAQNDPPRAAQNDPPRAVQNEPPRAVQNEPPRAVQKEPSIAPFSFSPTEPVIVLDRTTVLRDIPPNVIECRPIPHHYHSFNQRDELHLLELGDIPRVRTDVHKEDARTMGLL
jgi:hypothetical protein